MNIKIFGKSLFEFNKSEAYMLQATTENKNSKYLPDFYKDVGGSIGFSSGTLENWVVTEVGTGAMATQTSPKEPVKEKEEKNKLTPKEVFTLKMLNDKVFKLNTNAEYVYQKLSDFKDKLSLIKSEEYDMRHGVTEISSVIMRLENRKKYAEVKDFFENYPYTQTSKISDLVKAHDYLKLGQVAQFVADMPKEAIDVMKEYNKYTDKVCGKQAVFYIIADKKDFEKSNNRRDPILLAQSPFGHFWQILGAWDKEMLFVEEL